MRRPDLPDDVAPAATAAGVGTPLAPASGVRLRALTAGDVPAVAALLDAALGRRQDRVRRQLAVDLGSDGYAWFVAVDGEAQLVGVAGVRKAFGSDVADVLDVAVAADARRRGVGRRLVRRLVDEAVTLAASAVVLEVALDAEPAQALYASEGFERTRLRRGYTHDGTDAWEMVRRLDEPPTDGPSADDHAGGR